FGETGSGSFAEYAAVRETKLALKPANLSFAAAAAVPVAAFTALQGLQDFGAEVTGVCSTRNLELVRSIGADHVIDYTREDFTKNGQRYDLIYDAVGNRSVSDYQRALGPNGICAVAGITTLSR